MIFTLIYNYHKHITKYINLISVWLVQYNINSIKFISVSFLKETWNNNWQSKYKFRAIPVLKLIPHSLGLLGLEMCVHAFPASAVDEPERSSSGLGLLAPGEGSLRTPWRESWLGPGACLHVTMAEGSLSFQGTGPGNPAIILVTLQTEFSGLQINIVSLRTI
jgi:hypothetical protein